MTQNNNCTQARCAGVKSIGKPDWIGQLGRKLQQYSGFRSALSDSSTALNRAASGSAALAGTRSRDRRRASPEGSSMAGAHSLSRGLRSQNSSLLMSHSVAAFFAALALCMGTAAHAADDSSKHFEIKAKPLADALMEFGVQSGLTVVAPTTLTAGKKGASVRGDLAPTDALGRLLKGSGLTYSRAADGTIAIQAIPSNGPVQASAGESGLEKDLTRTAQLEEVIVTGSRIPAHAKEGAQEVKVYTREKIEQSGQTTVVDFLNTLPYVSVSIGENTLQTPLGATTVQLHGLPIGTTLVLLNGRRVETSGATTYFFDLNN